MCKSFVSPPVVTSRIMESYIVRIYRREDDPKMEMAGTVEEVGVGPQSVFHTSQELIDILSENNNAQSNKCG